MKVSKSTIEKVLNNNPSVIFAYLYGSCLDSESFQDVDIAVYSTDESDPFRLSFDLKIALAEDTELPPEIFDVRAINHLLDKGDMFALLYLKEVLSKGKLLVDKNFSERSKYIESFSMKYRQCEGLIAEVLA
jgi:predicted nucleotidyltransferase